MSANPAPLPSRQRKTKKDGSPTWDQTNPSFRYDLPHPDIYYLIAGVASETGVTSVSQVAGLLLDYALVEQQAGRLRLDSRIQTRPRKRKMELVLLPDGWTRTPRPDYERKRKPAPPSPSPKRPSTGFRWGKERHQKIRDLAKEFDCSVGQMAEQLLAYALDSYAAGKFHLEIKYDAWAEAVGWEKNTT